jgi:hypothetical protein
VKLESKLDLFVALRNWPLETAWQIDTEMHFQGANLCPRLLKMPVPFWAFSGNE